MYCNVLQRDVGVLLHRIALLLRRQQLEIRTQTTPSLSRLDNVIEISCM